MTKRFIDVQQLYSETAQMVRADAPLYLFIILYTVAGQSFLLGSGTSSEAAYAFYGGRFLFVFAFFFPMLALLFDWAVILHRFDRRRALAARHMFSNQRIASLLCGVVLMQVMVLFVGTFTAVKNVLPVWQGGFPYDRLHADIDKALHFGADPWRWLYAFGGHDLVRVAVEWNYTTLYFVLCFGGLFFVVTSPAARSVRNRYLFEFMLVWIVVGNLLAGLFLSAGPAFYGFVTGDQVRFAEQLQFIAKGLGNPSSAARLQAYLWDLYATRQFGFASGISAFPSVHVGLVMMNALFLKDRDWRLGAIGFGYVALIMASSVYLGWHYAIDGYVAVVVVLGLHVALKKFAFPGRSFAFPNVSEEGKCLT